MSKHALASASQAGLDAANTAQRLARLAKSSAELAEITSPEFCEHLRAAYLQAEQRTWEALAACRGELLLQAVRLRPFCRRAILGAFQWRLRFAGRSFIARETIEPNGSQGVAHWVSVFDGETGRFIVASQDGDLEAVDNACSMDGFEPHGDGE